MPTGYTDGILKGTTKTFPDFAKKCMWAFCIHLKEVSTDKYEPRKPSDYYPKELKKAERHLKMIENYSDKQIVSLAKKRLMESKRAYIGYIKTAENNRKKLKKILSEINVWYPPTDEHLNFKKFMLEQIDTTMRFDGDSKYYQEELEKIEQRIKDIKADTSRTEMFERANGDVEYHKKHLDEDIKNCEATNKWVDDLMKSLKK